ncbi:DUF3035 domain-containing protein [Sneathiella litorea]|uniref:DUF3035 domain-containing protein n=1 Tax=Sneathiella litorea TaxID=2606216 RepID=A0A6L8W456_9PROT|nr:DUF3035 domain-containing protein [Sneathiella litorea]MZR29264.1 DUF3035 domain-containing protein [Sneathiella litorea]
MRNGRFLTGMVLLSAVLLTGCEGTKQALGIGNKEGPDEFTVITKAPLIIPPDFSLRPPAPGQKGPQEVLAENSAKAALLGTQVNTAPVTHSDAVAAGVTTGELALLRQAGAENVDPNIRQIIDTETAVLAENDETFMEKIMFWQEQPPFGTVVDPAKEKKRLQENAALGESPAAGPETPVIERRKRALLEGLFN